MLIPTSIRLDARQTSMALPSISFLSKLFHCLGDLVLTESARHLLDAVQNIHSSGRSVLVRLLMVLR